MGVGVGLGFATIVGACLRDLAPGQLGIGSGMSATTRQLGAVFGVASCSWPSSARRPEPGAYDAGWWAMAGLALLAVVPIVALPGERLAALGHGRGDPAVQGRRGRGPQVAERVPAAGAVADAQRGHALERRGAACARTASTAVKRSVPTRPTTASSSSQSSRRSLAASRAVGLAHVEAGVTSQTSSAGSSAPSSSWPSARGIAGASQLPRRVRGARIGAGPCRRRARGAGSTRWPAAGRTRR